MGTNVEHNERKGGVFLSWTKVGLIVLVGVCILVATVLLVLHASPRCVRQPKDCLPSMDEALLWQTCVNLSISENRSLCLDEPPIAVTGPKNYRLSKSLFPTHYNIEIKVDIYQSDPENFTKEGYVEMFLRCAEETDKISFNTRALDILGISVTSVDGENITIEDVSSDITTEMVHIRLNRTLLEDEDVVVRVAFAGEVSNISRGLYYGSYWDPDKHRMEYLVASQLEPTSARQTFPCFDEPGFKATFNVSLWRKDGFTALSNMPKYASIEKEDGWYVDHFSMTPVPMTTYLLCIVISRFEFISDVADGGLSSKQIRYFAQKDFILNGHMEFAKSIGGRIFDWMELQFEEPFALPKTDMVALNNFTAGAMENWGLITYRLSRLLFDGDHMLTKGRIILAETIAHELAHMWFGNVVTCSWWEDLWLQEGFASFYELESIRLVMKENDTSDAEVSKATQMAMNDDSSGRSHPLFYPVSAPMEIDTVFSTVTYKKGACIVRMMRDALGEMKFDKIIKVYMQRMKYRSVQHDDLLDLISQLSLADGVDIGVDFKEAMHTWIKQMGFPVVTIYRSNDSSSMITAEQTMFLSNSNATLLEKYPSEYNYTWTIPFTYTTSLSPNWNLPHREWLTGKKSEITMPLALSPDDWLIGNVRTRGFYRVNYDNIGWEANIRQLNTDHTMIDVMNRAHLIDDAFSLARNGMLGAVYGFRLTEYLLNETEWVPHQAFDFHLDRLRRLMEDTPAFSHLRMYVRQLAQSHYLNMGWTHNDKESLATRSLRATVLSWACTYGLGECIQEAQDLYNQWKKEPNNPQILHPDIRELMFCTAVQQTGEDEWNFLLSRYLAEGDRIDHSHRMALLGALGCTQKPWLVSRYIELFMEPLETASYNVARDRTSALMALVYNPVARLALRYTLLSGNWSEWSYNSRLAIFMALCKYWSTEQHLETVASFHQSLNRTSLESYRQQAIRHIKSNKEWHQNNLHSVTEWLQQANRKFQIQEQWS